MGAIIFWEPSSSHNTDTTLSSAIEHADHIAQALYRLRNSADDTTPQAREQLAQLRQQLHEISATASYVERALTRQPAKQPQFYAAPQKAPLAKVPHLATA